MTSITELKTPPSIIRDIAFKRIIDNIKINVNTRCWEWKGANSGTKGRGHGYGRLSIYGRTSAVHRVMWSCVHGFLPNSLQIDHTCANRICCNPDHLELVTASKNQKRKFKRQFKTGETK